MASGKKGEPLPFGTVALGSTKPANEARVLVQARARTSRKNTQKNRNTSAAPASPLFRNTGLSAGLADPRVLKMPSNPSTADVGHYSRYSSNTSRTSTPSAS